MKNTTALTLLAATLFTGSAAMADVSHGEQHGISAKLRKDTIPPTAVVTAHHLTCQKDHALRHTAIEVEIAADIDGVKQDKLLELRNEYERVVGPLFFHRKDITRADIQSTLQEFMKTVNSIHFQPRVALAHFIPVTKANDPCPAPAVK